MGSTRKIGLYVRLSRPRTALSTVLASIGGVLYPGFPNSIEHVYIAMLTIVGVAVAHLSANAINEYVDFVTGVDLKTRKTPFTGGTKVLVEGLLKPSEAITIGILYLAIAVFAGAYLTMIRGPLVLVLALAGAIIVLGYSIIFVKIGLGEISLIAKGILVFAGSTYIMTGSLLTGSFLVGALYGATSASRLLVRHIPDREADRAAGRKTIPVILGERSWIACLAIALAIVALIVTLPLIGILTKLALLALAPAILGVLVALRVRDMDSKGDHVEVLRGNNLSNIAIEVMLTISIMLETVAKI